MASSRATFGAQPESIWQKKPPSVLTPPATTQQARSYHTQQPQQGYLPNGAAPGHQAALTGATPLLPNQGRVIQSGPIRVLCIADVRGMQAISTTPRPALSLS